MVVRLVDDAHRRPACAATIPALLDAWYERAGTALHDDGRKPHHPEVARELLAELGLDPGLVDEAIADPTTTTRSRPTTTGSSPPGGAACPRCSSPTGTASSDRWSSSHPTGDAALASGELVCGWLEFPDLYELQATEDAGRHRAHRRPFRPYLEARDWITIQNATP